jgi:hypothetical protein
MNLTAYFHLVLRLRMHEAIPPFPHASSYHVSLSTGTILPLMSLKINTVIHFIECIIPGYGMLITLHSLDPKLVKMTAGYGTSHTNIKTHIQYI